MVEKICFNKKNQEKQDENDLFEVLDNIDFAKAKKLSEEPHAFEVANGMINDLNKSEVGNLIKKEMKEENFLETPSGAPKNFNEMLDTATGNALQRLSKWYIKTGNSEKTMEILESIGVDKFRNVVKNVVIKFLYKKPLEKLREIAPEKNTNYTLANTKLNSLIDFAVNKASLNELMHIVGSAGGIIAITENLIKGPSVGNIAFSSGLFLVNLYCVLAQRYTRAELGIIIDRKLRNHADFDPSRYSNILNIKFPKKEAI